MKAASLAALALCATALCACTSEVFDPMENQPRYKPYRESTFFDDGRAMRTPPAGTVPREATLGSPQLTMGGVGGEDGGTVEGVPETIPLPVTRELVETGQHHFQIICATCHGLLGDGNSIAGHKMSLRPPPSLYAKKHRDGDLYRITSLGYGVMPGYASELTVRERWAVVAYVRALEKSQNASIDKAPPQERERMQKEGR